MGVLWANVLVSRGTQNYVREKKFQSWGEVRWAYLASWYYCTQNRYKSASNKVSDCEWRHEKTHSYVPKNFEFLKLKLWALQIIYATATKTNTVTAMRLPAHSYCKKETQSYYKHWIRPTVRKNGRICNNCSLKNGKWTHTLKGGYMPSPSEEQKIDQQPQPVLGYRMTPSRGCKTQTIKTEVY